MRNLPVVTRTFLSLSIALTAVLSIAQEESNDQSDPMGDQVDGSIEEIVTLGTRVESRTIEDAVVPIDLFDSEQIEHVNSSDLIEVLSTIIPSFAVRRQPISDGASFVRPTHMRNMEIHHSLVLLGNKRRHRSAFMLLGGSGSHGADIGSVPSIAIDTVEVLRDGAAAQYGSDAIAGVLNFRLRSNDSGGMVRMRMGGYTVGDGMETTIDGTFGTTLFGTGFLNLSFQISESEATNRSQPYDIAIPWTSQLPSQAVFNELTVDGITYYGPDAFTYTYDESGNIVQVTTRPDGIPDDRDRRYADHFPKVGGNRPFSSPAQIWGQPEREQTMFVVNAGQEIGENAEAYGFMTFAKKEQIGGFFYRRPGISTFLPVRLQDGSIYDARRDLFPGGFTPQFSGAVNDVSMHGGFRDELQNGWEYDLSVGFGSSEVRYTLENTLNPSLGPATPTKFRPGNLVNTEYAINLDLNREFDLTFANPLHVAIGLEWRNDIYDIQGGDEPSWEAGPFAYVDPFNFEITQSEVDADDNDEFTVIECRIPGFQTIGSLCPEGDPINNSLPIGSNGFPGYSPLFSTEFDQSSYAVYSDFELELTSRWLANAAIRHEHFQGFGEVTIWKLASRIELHENANLRASIGTGFRAPSTGQLSTTNVSTRINAEGIPIAVGIFPATHAASKLFGSVPLEPETSANYSIGLTFSPTSTLNVAIDHYQIEMEKRLILSSRFTVTPEQRLQLLALNVPGAAEIGQVSVFTNDIDTRTSGIDVVLSETLQSRFGVTTLSANVNFNETEITERGRYVGDEGEFDLENGVPANRWVLGINHQFDNFDIFLRIRKFGEYENASNATLTTIQSFPAEYMVDLNTTINIRENYVIRLGAENIFDNYPDPGDFEACCGRIYRSDSMVPWQGTLVYGQFSIQF